MAYGIEVGGEDGSRKMPKKKKKKVMHSDQVKGGGSMEMQSMLKKAYGRGKGTHLALGQ